MNAFFQNRGFWFRLGILIALTAAGGFVAVTFGTVFAVLIFGSAKIASHDTDAVLFLQAFVTLGLFAAPALVFGRCFAENLTLRAKPKLTSVLVCVLIMTVSMPFCSFLEELNLSMRLPDSLSGLEDWMRRQEDAANLLTEKILSRTSPGYTALNLLVVALFPAFGEELYFRAAVQDSLLEKTAGMKGWICVIVTAAVFSAVHLQFFGFLPRLFLGMLLGFMLLVTRNIWVSVICHFFNNACAVLFFGSFSQEQMREIPQFWELKTVIVLSAVLIGLLFWFLTKILKK